MDARTADILKPYLRGDLYDTDMLYTDKCLLPPVQPKEYEVGDSVILTSKDGSEERGVITLIYLVSRDWKTEPSMYSYNGWLESGKEFHVGNYVSARKTAEAVTLPAFVTTRLDSSIEKLNSPITQEVYFAAVEHNKRVRAAAQAEETAQAETILEKDDAEITEDEWKFLVRAGYALPYHADNAPEDFADSLLYRRLARRQDEHPFFADETEEELARKGL